MSQTPIVGVILAGGRSVRMGGGDKCLLELDGRPLLSHVIERLRPQVAAIVLNANGEPSRFDGFGLPVVADRNGDDKGPLAGILAGMGWAREHMPEATFIATAAADTPVFPEDLVARLSGATGDEPRIAIARSAGRDHPTFGLLPIRLAEDLADFIATAPTLAITAWIGRHAWRAVEFPLDGSDGSDLFFSVNTPDDLSALRDSVRS